jgi:hypothetical protein
MSLKEDVICLEETTRDAVLASGLGTEEEEFLASFSAEQEAKVYRKVWSPIFLGCKSLLRSEKLIQNSLIGV